MKKKHAAIRGTETWLGRPREFDVLRREKEASKSENDLSCRVRRSTARRDETASVTLEHNRHERLSEIED